MTDLLQCPHCGRPLRQQERSWACAAGHAFNIARQGYVNLLTGPATHAGDTATMLDARTSVLAAGHLEVVTTAVIDAAGEGLPDGAVVEVGAGTAHHLAAVVRALGPRPAVALDASVAAAKRAARAGGAGLTAVVADAWERWPLLDGTAALVLSIFAPRNLDEAARILVPGGRLLVVMPAPDHLGELVEPLGLLQVDPDKVARLTAAVPAGLQVVDTVEVRTTCQLDRQAVQAVAAMGPSGFHLAPADLHARVGTLPSLTEVTIAVTVTRFARRP